jgi:hypothetical protein
MSAESQIKLRPYLSIAECKLILSSLPQEESELRDKLSILLLKYDAGFVKGSYVSSPRKTHEENLGFSESDLLSGNLTPEQELELTNKLMRGF